MNYANKSYDSFVTLIELFENGYQTHLRPKFEKSSPLWSHRPMAEIELPETGSGSEAGRGCRVSGKLWWWTQSSVNAPQLFPCFTGKIQGTLKFQEIHAKIARLCPSETLIKYIEFPISITGNLFRRNRIISPNQRVVTGT